MPVPKLRFKDNNDNEYPVWEEKKLGDVFSFLKNNSLSRDALGNHGTIKNIHYGDILIKYPSIVDVQKQEIPFIKELKFLIEFSKLEENKKKFYTLKDGDIVFADTAEDYTAGKVIEIKNVTCDVVSGLHTIPCRPHVRFELGFLGQYLNSNSFHNPIRPLMVGTKVISINKNELIKTKLRIPTLPEQKKIADFFSSFDKRRETTQKKLATLEKLKKGFMQKIFSQQLRFKDDNGNDYPAWKEKKLGDVMDDFSYGMNVSSKRFDGQNKYIRITDIDESTHKYDSSDIVSPDGKLEQKYLVKDGDILFARTGASVGKSYLYNSEDGNLYFAGFLIRGRVKSSYNPYFIYLQTLTFNYKKWVYVFSMRTGQPGINAEEYRSFKFLCPSLPEQKKIADFLSAFDEKMNLVRKEVDTLQTIKKGLLQQMFV